MVEDEDEIYERIMKDMCRVSPSSVSLKFTENFFEVRKQMQMILSGVWKEEEQEVMLLFYFLALLTLYELFSCDPCFLVLFSSWAVRMSKDRNLQLPGCFLFNLCIHSMWFYFVFEQEFT